MMMEVLIDDNSNFDYRILNTSIYVFVQRMSDQAFRKQKEWDSMDPPTLDADSEEEKQDEYTQHTY
jgi:hypothetical protein